MRGDSRENRTLLVICEDPSFDCVVRVSPTAVIELGVLGERSGTREELAPAEL